MEDEYVVQQIEAIKIRLNRYSEQVTGLGQRLLALETRTSLDAIRVEASKKTSLAIEKDMRNFIHKTNDTSVGEVMERLIGASDDRANRIRVSHLLQGVFGFRRYRAERGGKRLWRYRKP